MSEIPELPRPETDEGTPRRVGIEVELGGLTESAVADVIAGIVGGTVRAAGQYEWTVSGSEIGDIEVLLDTALRDKADGALARMGLDLGRAVIPVEFVTEPVLPREIAKVDEICRALAARGAFGTRDGVALGFGVHLNVALADTGVDTLRRTILGFALVEDLLRDRMDIDPSRRLMPFVDPYAPRLLDLFCAPEARTWSRDALIAAYLSEAPSRNHALDALPILKWIDADRVVAAVPAMSSKSARPAWHYRLPDCRIDDPDWSLVQEWARWVWIERLAGNDAVIDALCGAWRDYRQQLLPIGRWAQISNGILEEQGVPA